MGIIDSNMINTGIFFLFIFLSGFWVSRTGKPYNGFIFNIHKFIGLGMGVFLIRTVYLTNQAVHLTATLWTAIAVTVFLFILTVAAGGLLGILAEGGMKNIDEARQRVIELVHKFSPYLIVVATLTTLYMLFH
jgi:hypothetical protein